MTSANRCEQAMGNYCRLAVISQRKGQGLHRDRFLLLTATMACRAGWLEVAEACRERLRSFAPHHQLSRFTSMADALRNADFAALAHRWERYCPPERAEHLLQQLIDAGELAADDTQLDAGPRALHWLAELPPAS